MNDKSRRQWLRHVAATCALAAAARGADASPCHRDQVRLGRRRRSTHELIAFANALSMLPSWAECQGSRDSRVRYVVAAAEAQSLLPTDLESVYLCVSQMALGGSDRDPIAALSKLVLLNRVIYTEQPLPRRKPMEAVTERIAPACGIALDLSPEADPEWATLWTAPIAWVGDCFHVFATVRAGLLFSGQLPDPRGELLFLQSHLVTRELASACR